MSPLNRKWRRHAPSYHVTEDPYYPGIQHTFVETQQTSSVYPALLKRPTPTQGPTPTACNSPKRTTTTTNGPQTGTAQCCYGCTEPLAYNAAVTSAAAETPPNQQQSTRDTKSSRPMECCRVLECPDVMTHVVTLNSSGGHQQGQTCSDHAKTGPVHHYETAAFCRGHVVVAKLDAAAASIIQAGDYAPGRRDGDNVRCYRAVAGQDQSKRNDDIVTEMGAEYRSTVQPL